MKAKNLSEDARTLSAYDSLKRCDKHSQPFPFGKIPFRSLDPYPFRFSRYFLSKSRSASSTKSLTRQRSFARLIRSSDARSVRSSWKARRWASFNASGLVAPIKPPGQQWEQDERAGQQEDREDGTEGCNGFQ